MAFGFGLAVPELRGGGPVPVPIVGSALGGGYFAGQISTTASGVANYNLIVAPLSSGASGSIQWKVTKTGGDSTSYVDGYANSTYYNSTTYPAMYFCKGLSIGGFTDWYLPAYYELDVCYYNLKPSTTANDTATGTNIYAVPPRASNYTTSVPAQTSAAIFQTSGAQAWNIAGYWASTVAGYAIAWTRYFGTGGTGTYGAKNYSFSCRAIRKVAV